MTCCREVLGRSVVAKVCCREVREVMERSVVDKCCGEVL